MIGAFGSLVQRTCPRRSPRSGPARSPAASTSPTGSATTRCCPGQRVGQPGHRQPRRDHRHHALVGALLPAPRLSATRGSTPPLPRSPDYGGYLEIKKDAGTWLYGAQINTRSPGLELNDAGYQINSGPHLPDGLAHPALAPARERVPHLPAPAQPVARLGLRRARPETGLELVGNAVLKNYGTPQLLDRRQPGRPGALGAPGRARARCSRPADGSGRCRSSDPRKAVRLTVDMPTTGTTSKAWARARPSPPCCPGGPRAASISPSARASSMRCPAASCGQRQRRGAHRVRSG